MTPLQIIYITGIANVVLFLLIVFSCRCMGINKGLFDRLIRYKWYQKFYSKHCYYWWAFLVSIVIHAIAAFQVFGFPF
ncbi:MAG: hypothetical protein JXB14_00920 [Candidatus Altiarchaeota archaeon]|nr:hypothetical protein [Candidatus Altiarchaeota archaeon]